MKKVTALPFGRKVALGAVCYLLLTAMIFWVVADDWHAARISVAPVSSEYLTEEIDQQRTLTQTFTSAMDEVTALSLSGVGSEGSVLRVQLLDDDVLLWESTVPGERLRAGEQTRIDVAPAVTGVKGKLLTLAVRTDAGTAALWYGTTVQAGKFDVAVEKLGTLTVGGKALPGSVAMGQFGRNVLNAEQFYWPVVLALGAAVLTLLLLAERGERQGKRTWLGACRMLVRRYRYLIKQLVSRDFKVKYKASMLGVFWSFLNPLLTMTVYFFVFSLLFRSDIDHFPAYLISGIVLFNFFSESTTLGLNSIVINASLIKKVYMPKWIYPLSKVMSSTVNMVIALIPMGAVMLLTGVPISKSILLLPLVVLFMFLFCLGMSLILSTMMVFFRDMQFLWSVLITMWNFLTPVFYPEYIIPASFRPLYHLNPLYQIITFMRTITLDGMAPSPLNFLYCLLAAGIPLAIGIWAFRKHQDTFILYL